MKLKVFKELSQNSTVWGTQNQDLKSKLPDFKKTQKQKQTLFPTTHQTSIQQSPLYSRDTFIQFLSNFSFLNKKSHCSQEIPQILFPCHIKYILAAFRLRSTFIDTRTSPGSHQLEILSSLWAMSPPHFRIPIYFSLTCFSRFHSSSTSSIKPFLLFSARYGLSFLC